MSLNLPGPKIPGRLKSVANTCCSDTVKNI